MRIKQFQFRLPEGYVYNRLIELYRRGEIGTFYLKFDFKLSQNVRSR